MEPVLCDRGIFVLVLTRMKSENGGNRRKEERGKKGGGGGKIIFYSGFTFQNTATAATVKTNTPTTAWIFRLGPADTVAGCCWCC